MRVKFAHLAASLLVLALVASAAAQDVVVASATHPDHGAYLTDGDGRALYLFTADPAGESTCVDTCAENWPPLLAGGTVTAGSGVAASLLDTVARADGTLQVTYAGIPLYYFVQDAGAGDTLGQARGDAWYLVSPFGTAIVPRQAAAPAPETTAAPIEPMLLSSLMAEGSATYSQSCATCHGATGEGGNGPVLAGADLSDLRRVVRQITRGSGHMPGFGSVLDDAQVAAVVTFIRSSWGNAFAPVVAEEVMPHR